MLLPSLPQSNSEHPLHAVFSKQLSLLQFAEQSGSDHQEVNRLRVVLSSVESDLHGAAESLTAMKSSAVALAQLQVEHEALQQRCVGRCCSPISSLTESQKPTPCVCFRGLVYIGVASHTMRVFPWAEVLYRYCIPHHACVFVG